MVLSEHLPLSGIRTPDLPALSPKVLSIRPPHWYPKLFPSPDAWLQRNFPRCFTASWSIPKPKHFLCLRPFPRNEQRTKNSNGLFVRFKAIKNGKESCLRIEPNPDASWHKTKYRREKEKYKSRENDSCTHQV